VAGIARSESGWQLWTFGPDGGSARVVESKKRLSFPAWTADGESVACLSYAEGHQYVSLECGESVESGWNQEAYGPIAFSSDGKSLFYSSPNDRGFLDLWARELPNGDAVQLSHFTRDSYAPSVTRDGRVLFKQQMYQTFLAAIPADGGPPRELTIFQSETPFWNWSSTQISFTFGSWRRVIDDFHYPDIAQHVGIINVDQVPKSSPDVIVRKSTSEDQGMSWSPNGKWIAYHSHYGPSDDIWLIPADQSQEPRQISFRGHETGWPRWSDDGRWVLYTSLTDNRPKYGLYLIGMDQETGEVTEYQKEVPLEDFPHHELLAEWSSDFENIIFESSGPTGTKGLYIVPKSGGKPRRIHEFKSEQLYSGIGVSPDGRWIAFVQPASDGYFQIFRVPLEGRTPEQLTFDRSHKTQPSYAPNGKEIAFTVFVYESQFWLLAP
jgi:Tol biopolymer transport system component